MKKVLYILGLLRDEDVDWLVSAGTRKRYTSGETLITEGVPGPGLFIVTEGRAEVFANEKKVNEVGQGEVLGEISLLDSRPPTATVKAGDEMTCLCVPFDTLRSKMDADTKFAANFYRALGMFMAARMRAMTFLATGRSIDDGMEEDVELPDEIDPEMLEEITLAGARFRMLMDKLKSR